MAQVLFWVLPLLLLAAAADAQSEMPADAPGMSMDGVMAPMGPDGAMAPGPDAAMEPPAEEAPAEQAEAPPYYPPKPSAGTWFSWLPEDPLLLAGVIISFLSAAGFLFIIWTVSFELILGPFCMTLVDAFAQRKLKH